MVDSDVKTANAIGLRDPIKFNRISDNKFMVIRVREPGIAEYSVVFEMTPSGITVKAGGHETRPSFKAKPVLLRLGECQLEIEGEESEPLELWQVSRRALENLFFGL